MEKTFDINAHIDINGSWCGSAYFVNRNAQRTYAIHSAAMPGEKATPAKEKIRAYLDTETERMIAEGWTRVSREEMHECDKEFRAAKKLANNMKNQLHNPKE